MRRCRRPPRRPTAAARNSSGPRPCGPSSAPTERHALSDGRRLGARGGAVARRPSGDRGRLGAAHAAAGRRAGGAGGAALRPARDDHARADARRAGDPRPRRQPARRRHLRPVPRRARGDPQPRPAPPPQPLRAAGRRGQGRHPDAADQVRAPRGVPDPRRRHRPGRRDLLRGRPGPLRRHGLLVVAAAGARRAAPHRVGGASPCARPGRGSCRCSTSCGGAAARPRRVSSCVRAELARVPEPLGGRTDATSGARPLQRLPAVALRRRQARRRGPRKDVARTLWHRSPGSPG